MGYKSVLPSWAIYNEMYVCRYQKNFTDVNSIDIHPLHVVKPFRGCCISLDAASLTIQKLWTSFLYSGHPRCRFGILGNDAAGAVISCSDARGLVSAVVAFEPLTDFADP